MNINEAKVQIKNAMRAYFTKDAFGNYVIPIEKQRPVFLVGPPGIGKTAIMEQIAAELGVGLVSYSMTHHTRQSALGLPFIEKKTYGGVEYNVSEYTMSEIIASVYDMIEQTGLREGILFLDEINCVSETLAPSMLQFLQYKIFGKHRVPSGWIVVTAGNPPEYNNSVREFDVVTWDRLKRIDVEPDHDAWKTYAYKKGVHASIMTYLDIKKGDFYKIESTVDGKSFVTARGWSDLSDMIVLYEKLGIKVDESLISQYVQNKKITKEFAIYYDLFNTYKSDYQIDRIMDGTNDPLILDRAKSAKADERFAFVGLLLDGITTHFREVDMLEMTQVELMRSLKSAKINAEKKKCTLDRAIEDEKRTMETRIRLGKQSSSMSVDTETACRHAMAAMEEILRALALSDVQKADVAFMQVKSLFDLRTAAMKKRAAEVGKKLSNIFRFCERAFGDGQEILILVTELTINYSAAHFISRYGSKEYFAHNKELLFHERQKEIIRKLENLDL